ncbi:tRNA dimethylallyltransferase [Motilibacter rhizosphaerae]|uniref:tRNA dimethylallyltransferase n=1 Tax=Motilibacter rhizosphaerae TaxID=598652 RepID=A0A4Q7NPM6_9ACTN|nr:tRNA dimethylallyltransferase [Motilibacter rhizosphaerae]
MTLVAVVGATATGKTELGVRLALALGGEVVNADSMQLYRGMDIGTAKASEEERQGVPHHVLDLWPVTEPADVARYRTAARAAVAEIEARGRTPVLVGGSGLYVRAVLDDLELPGTDPEVRRALEAELAEVGPAALHARLATRDPAAAAAILPSNGRRLVRALEVVELTGSFRAQLPEPRYLRPTVQLGVRRERSVLDERIAARVDRMWERGLVDEVERLVGEGLAEGPTASRALGYAQVLRALEGATTLDAAREETVRATRRFARRQESWFGRDPRVRWVDGGDAAGLDALVAELAASPSTSR